MMVRFFCFTDVWHKIISRSIEEDFVFRFGLVDGLYMILRFKMLSRFDRWLRQVSASRFRK